VVGRARQAEGQLTSGIDVLRISERCEVDRPIEAVGERIIRDARGPL